MALRILRAKAMKSLTRNYSSGGKLIDVNINENTGIATVTLQRLPVNSMNCHLLTEFVDVLDELETIKIRGMILTSASETVFSAGLDIMEMHKPEEKKSKKFWTALQDCWVKLYGCSIPTVAAINGHAPAGECLLAMSCEYRVMVNHFSIGFNETKLGLVLPKWCIASMLNTISKRDTELALTSGHLFTAEEALKIGLVDEIADDKGDALAKAAKFIERFDKVNPLSRLLTKASLRANDLQDLLDNREADLEIYWTLVCQPALQNILTKYIEGLKNKRK